MSNILGRFFLIKLFGEIDGIFEEIGQIYKKSFLFKKNKITFSHPKSLSKIRLFSNFQKKIWSHLFYFNMATLILLLFNL